MTEHNMEHLIIHYIVLIIYCLKFKMFNLILAIRKTEERF